MVKFCQNLILESIKLSINIKGITCGPNKTYNNIFNEVQSLSSPKIFLFEHVKHIVSEMT